MSMIFFLPIFYWFLFPLLLRASPSYIIFSLFSAAIVFVMDAARWWLNCYSLSVAETREKTTIWSLNSIFLNLPRQFVKQIFLTYIYLFPGKLYLYIASIVAHWLMACAELATCVPPNPGSVNTKLDFM